VTRTVLAIIATLGAAAVLAACGTTARPAASTAGSAGSTASLSSAAASSSSADPGASSSAPSPASAASAAPGKAAPTTAVAAVTGSGTGPVIVIDPGHAPTINSIDAATGLNDSDYENEPEMRDVFAVAQLVRAQLITAGYRVVLTKNTVTDRVSLGARAAVANNAHAALALSIHDQAGASGGLPFATANNTVYYQTVGDYRATPNGTHVTFTDATVAAASAACGALFQAKRAAAEGHTVHLQKDVGYDLGTRGLAAGNIWMVQLLSKGVWIYNEAGGNSAGQAGLNATDEQKYANGLVAGVEACVPVGG
jgi:N-acetylmuramoyl-L-alanine amidase